MKFQVMHSTSATPLVQSHVIEAMAILDRAANQCLAEAISWNDINIYAANVGMSACTYLYRNYPHRARQKSTVVSLENMMKIRQMKESSKLVASTLIASEKPIDFYLCTGEGK